MSRLFSFHESAEAEVNEAADFYDLEDPGLGNVFLDEVERAIEAIAQYPEAAPLIRGGVRKKSLLKFPYSLLYSVRPHEIRLLAVAHQKRRPFYWRGRR
jgi:plasmid stabilization system protein ParE